MIHNKRVQNNFSSIIASFSIKGSPARIEPHGTGHIHDTFRIINAELNSPDYLLQHINHYIFKDIPALTENILCITNHLRKKIDALPGMEPDKKVLSLVPTKAGLYYHKDAKGNFWRIYRYLKDTRSYDVAQTVQQAYEGGKAFGEFQTLLSDLNPKSLHETIPRFHDVENRFDLFLEAMARDPKARIKSVTSEIAFAKARIESMATISKLGRRGELPLRITHNDTKFNNVLLDRNDKAQCVIDLDTVMPGFIAYDFGDAVRTITNTGAEDEKDLDKIKVDMDLFKGFAKGFLEETKDFMNDVEISSLSQGVLLLPFIMGLRFLTDYLEGDHYYKISFPDHNIQRARAQFKLVERLEAQYDLIQETIQSIAKKKNKKIKESNQR